VRGGDAGADSRTELGYIKRRGSGV